MSSYQATPLPGYARRDDTQILKSGNTRYSIWLAIFMPSGQSSQNKQLQRRAGVVCFYLAVETCSTFNVDHQIIFTASMIAPELDKPDLTVGDFYTETNKSLRI